VAVGKDIVGAFWLESESRAEGVALVDRLGRGVVVEAVSSGAGEEREIFCWVRMVSQIRPALAAKISFQRFDFKRLPASPTLSLNIAERKNGTIIP
jgi:hypothetical protein